MPGTRPRPRRPVLLILVYGAFLALVGVTATAQSALVSAHFSASTLDDVVASDAATTRAFITTNIGAADLERGGASAAEVNRLNSVLASLVRSGEILRVELRLPDGTIAAASDPSAAGAKVQIAGDFGLAVGGSPQATIVPVESAAAGPGSITAPTVLREYLPITSNGQVHAVMAIWRDAQPILDRLAGVRRDVVIVTLSAGLIAAGLLFLIFRSTQARLTRQTAALVESTRRDPLTGALNHSAMVTDLADRIERARAHGGAIGVALLDVDNFRLVNDTHGHRAGDVALLALVGLLEQTLPGTIAMGRTGPDEFLLVAGAESVAELEPAIERVRNALVDVHLQFGDSERLPITISAGLCTYPEHASSVTALLSIAAQTLEAAKAGGGDAVRLADDVPNSGAGTSSFDVFQGLVFAVDTKDRYTKRHSEDVARYAVFLAEQLGLDPELVRSVHLAGLLHDVGKIGIPDPILRKPDKLNADEYAIVQQHVALGDMIVRDLPDIDLVRAGIRHHHERWDGAGYLDHLAGEEIPLIGRILAVGDAFSAMTTTRPYRKALDVREALRRLEDAAGTQLEERLVAAFVRGIETAADPPLPGADVASASLWNPRRRAA